MTIILYLFFFFNDTATTEIYTLSLHDALPIWCPFECRLVKAGFRRETEGASAETLDTCRDRKSTRLNSSHSQISYAVFCLKKKKTSHCMSLLVVLRLSSYCCVCLLTTMCHVQH